MTRIELNIDDRKIELAFGLGYLGELLEYTDKTLDEIVVSMQRNPFKTVPVMMWVSAKYAVESKGDDFDLSLVEFIELIEKDGGVNSIFSLKFLEQFKKHLSNKNVPITEPRPGAKTQKKR